MFAHGALDGVGVKVEVGGGAVGGLNLVGELREVLLHLSHQTGVISPVETIEEINLQRPLLVGRYVLPSQSRSSGVHHGLTSSPQPHPKLQGLGVQCRPACHRLGERLGGEPPQDVLIKKKI